jgi:hypothetical protein
MIDSQTPRDWSDLQDQVGRILKESGFDVEVEKQVTLARGGVEIDVYAEEKVDGRVYRIVCECKHWKSSVPQSVIYGFRSVVSGLGVNAGYIISTGGFQSGSYSASQLTNIDLLDWEEFQLRFLDSWFEQHFVKVMTEELDPLMTYTEPIRPKWFSDLTEDGKRHYMDLYNTYGPFGITVMSLFSTYSRMIGDDEIPELPLKNQIINPDPEKPSVPKHILEAESYRKLLYLSLKFGKKGIRKFRRVKDKHSV